MIFKHDAIPSRLLGREYRVRRTVFGSTRMFFASLVYSLLVLNFIGTGRTAMAAEECVARNQTIPRSSFPAPKGLRPDAPKYALHGAHWVGYRLFTIPATTDRPVLQVKSWYPALNPCGEKEEVEYSIQLALTELGIHHTAVVYGHAIKDAKVELAAQAYPLIVFSHAYGGNPEWFSDLMEHYASQGFVVLVPQHSDADWLSAWSASFERPREIKRVLDFAELLQAPKGELAGAIDMGKIAVVGHSYGGFTALALGGARFDLEPFKSRCAALAPGDAFAFFCDPFIDRLGDMAALAGLDTIPEGLWPSQMDARVKAVIPIAGDAYLFNAAGLAGMTVPLMAMGGTQDQGTPYEWGALPAYAYAASERKALVAFTGADHMIASNTCDAMPWTAELGPFQTFFCYDPVWDKRRALDLINHYSTAFLLDVLNGDTDAHQALLPTGQSFPGIEYLTNLQ